MDQLLSQLTSKANLTTEQAQKAIDVVADFVREKLPDPLAGPVLKALEGNDDAASQLKGIAEGAMGKLGGLFGGDK